MKPVEFHPGAEVDAAEAMAWYGQRSARTSTTFLVELTQVIERIAESPRRCPIHDGTARRHVLKSFPFLVLYREQADRIQILAIAHGRRRPGYWHRRR